MFASASQSGVPCDTRRLWQLSECNMPALRWLAAAAQHRAFVRHSCHTLFLLDTLSNSPLSTTHPESVQSYLQAVHVPVAQRTPQSAALT